jgi:hypothetical protein
MAEVDSRKQEDELLANAKLVDPDEALVPATKFGITQPLWNYGGGTRIEYSRRPMGSRESEKTQRTRFKMRG